MPPAKKAINAKVKPSRVNVMLGHTYSFNLFNGNKRLDDVVWALAPEHANAGTMSGATFKAHKNPRDSWAKITGETRDGKFYGEARVHIMINWGMPDDGPVLVDNWSTPQAGTSGTPWNTILGRRAWLIMMDILHQMPPTFLKSIGQVAMVRAEGTYFGGNKSSATHWPFDRRAVIYPNSFISDLTPSNEFTDYDRDFAETFVHELAHAVLTKRGFTDSEKFLRALGELTGWVNWIIGMPVRFLISPLSFLFKDHPPPRDFLSDYAQATGWVVNAVHRNNLFWGMFHETALPNILSGSFIIGRNPWYHLRNIHLPDKFTKENMRLAGFPPNNPWDYPATDVHEDFACSLVYLAFNPDWEKKRPRFKSRAEFFYKHKIWTKGKSLELGNYLNAWALAQRKSNPKHKLPSVNNWAVHFGPYAGKPGNESADPLPPGWRVTPRKGMKASSVSLATETAEDPDIQNAEDIESSDDVDEDEKDYSQGEGFEADSPFDDSFNEVYQQIQSFDAFQEANARFEKEVEPTIKAISDALSGVEIPAMGELPVHFLRLCETLGEGLRPCTCDARTQGCQVGDLIIDKVGNVSAVVSVDEEGLVNTIAGMSDDADEPAKEFNEKNWRFIWRPNAKHREWQSARDIHYRDLNFAMRHLIGLWGETVSPVKRDLSLGASLLAEVLDAAGIIISGLKPAKWWEDWLLKDVEEFCGKYGAGIQELKDVELKVGDVVRLTKPDRLGVVVRIREESVDLLVNGGDAEGAFGEEYDAAKMLHAFELKHVSWVWHPSGKPL